MEPELSVRDVLTKEYVAVNESDSVRGTARLMREERAACAIVVRGADPIGIMTEWDVLGLVATDDDPGETTVGDLMSTPVLSIEPDRSLADAANTMVRERIRNLLVEDGGETVGVLTQRDVIAAAGSFQGTTATSRDVAEADAADASAGSEAVAVANGDEYTTQGVCEACGSLADSLWESNGRLLCSDCRTV